MRKFIDYAGKFIFNCMLQESVAITSLSELSKDFRVAGR